MTLLEIPRFKYLFQPGLAQAIEKLGHRAGRVGNILLAPSNGDVGLQFP
jgi:hypothetical protein